MHFILWEIYMSYEFEYIAFAFMGYFLGSILFAKVFGYVFTKEDITLKAKDKNPGTFNAYSVGGFWCGTLTIICELAKGMVPVFLCLNYVDVKYNNEVLMALVMLSPIIGHILPIFHGFRGGKGIAVTFGSLLGFLVDLRPALLLAIVFIVFSLILIIKPDYYKTMITFIVAALIAPFIGYRTAIVITYVAAAIIVCIKLFLSKEEKESFRLSFIKWDIIGEKEGQ